MTVCDLAVTLWTRVAAAPASVDTGEVRTGRIRPANRGTVRTFLTRMATKETIVAVEAMTGRRSFSSDANSDSPIQNLARAERVQPAPNVQCGVVAR